MELQVCERVGVEVTATEMKHPAPRRRTFKCLRILDID